MDFARVKSTGQSVASMCVGVIVHLKLVAYGGSNDDVIDDVMLPSMVKVVIPISLRPLISKTAQDRGLVLTGHHTPPNPI